MGRGMKGTAENNKENEGEGAREVVASWLPLIRSGWCSCFDCRCKATKDESDNLLSFVRDGNKYQFLDCVWNLCEKRTVILMR